MKKIKMRKVSKGLWVILISFIILMIGDMVSTLLNHKVLKYLEVNPIYVFTDSMIPIILLNLIFIFFIYYIYTTRKPIVRFCICNYFAWFSIIRVYAIRANIINYLNPPTHAELVVIQQTFTAAVKVNYYYSTMAAYIMPFFITIIIYLIFSLDHKIEVKGEK